ncbi:MAG: DUF262 domain-containing protein [Caldilineaceae bacterium]
MREILGQARTVRELLSNQKYSIDYYQREFRWGRKQVSELIEDLASRFSDDFENGHSREEVENYGHYFLGSIIVSQKDNRSFIVDGQQRLTTLTLVLIYLNERQKERPDPDQVNVDDLIFSVKFGRKSFNIDIEDRNECMEALYEGRDFDPNGSDESVQNIVARYSDIQELFPSELVEDALPFFLDWLIENVHLVEITAFSDDDAYAVFEAMNDRGLSLTATEMLKGYLLANIETSKQKTKANDLWKAQVLEIKSLGKEADSDFIKTWLRSQYASSIRERSRGAKPKDFDLIGTEFHRWIRDNSETVGLETSEDFFNFIKTDFDFYAKHYKRLIGASRSRVPGLEHVLYNAGHGFTLQYMLLLAPLNPADSVEVVNLKVRLVARFLDILLTWRLWNFRSIAYSTMQYAMFLVMRDIRGLSPQPLAEKLWETLASEGETFATNSRLYMHQQNRWYLHRILARLTDYVERESGMAQHYVEYVTSTGKHRIEVEHIWANKPERHTDEFSHPTDFREYRNRFGGLLLLPKSFNASYGALPYTEKLPHYFGQNILAQSLHPDCYKRNPGFLQFIERSGLPFRPHEQFLKEDLDARQELYRQIAEQVWNPDELLREVGA